MSSKGGRKCGIRWRRAEWVRKAVLYGVGPEGYVPYGLGPEGFVPYGLVPEGYVSYGVCPEGYVQINFVRYKTLMNKKIN